MMDLSAELIGRRVVLRTAVPGETGPSGGPAMTDVIGRVVSFADEVVVVEKRDGVLVEVHAADVVLAKIVPDGPRRRRTRPAQDFGPDELTAICTRGWPPVESASIGAWLLRAAGGFTGRANSVAVHGAPGVSGDDALDQVAAFYRARGLPPRAQVVVGSTWEPFFESAGWSGGVGPLDGAVVRVVDLAEALPVAADPDPQVEVRDRADDAWVARYHRADAISDATVRAVLEAPPTVGFVRLGDPLVAIGRVVVTGEWAGLSCVEVSPPHRRRGLARRIVDASLRWASERGADKAYLQAARGNDAARALYAPYGFDDHHEYRYLAAG